MKILVTGGAGFIGSHVAEACLAAGHEVAVLDDLSAGKAANVPSDARFFEVDIRERGPVRRVFEEFRPQIVAHQAAQASVSFSVREPVTDAEVNVLGMLNLIGASQEFGVAKFIFASTGGAIYGEVPEGKRATVQWPARPMSPYACSKYAGEVYLAACQGSGELDYRVLRYANVYGPRQDPHGEAGVVAIFCRRLLAGQPIQINARAERGDDGCVRDYVYVGDVVKANLAAAEGRIEEPIFNVCTGEASTTLRIFEKLLGNLEVQADPLRTERRPGDLERSVLDAGQFRALIGEPMPLDEGLGHTADYFRTEGAR